MRIVTGCSRSGTSFICQLLAELGADFGGEDELIAGDEWNSRGYFEHKEINTLNHRLLFGRWSDPRLWVDHMWPKGRPFLRLRKRATLAIAPLATRRSAIRRRGRKLSAEIHALADAHRNRCVKDPRFCYLMQPWLEHGEVEGALFVLRHPGESAASMARMAGVPLPLARMGWLDSIRRFWDRPPGCPVHLVDYNDCLDPERGAAAVRPLFGFLGVPFDDARAGDALAAALDPEMRTHAAPRRRLKGRVERAYRALRERLGP